MLNGKAKKGDVIVACPMKFVKSTKTTHVFGNEDSGIGNIYLSRVLFNGQSPDKLTLNLSVTIETEAK